MRKPAIAKESGLDPGITVTKKSLAPKQIQFPWHGKLYPKRHVST